MRFVLLYILSIFIALPVFADGGEIEKLFYDKISTLNSLSQEELKEWKASLIDLRDKGGYSGISKFSEEALSAARTAKNLNNDNLAQFLTYLAVEVTPENPRILLAAASEISIIGFSQSLKYFFQGMSKFQSYPVFSASVFVNVIILALVSFTLSFVFVCFAQFIRSGELIYESILVKLPKKIKGLIAPFVFAFLLIAPLFGGVLFALFAWSLTIAFSRRNCRLFTLACGLLIISWSISYDYLETFSSQLVNKNWQIAENISNRELVPRVTEQLAPSSQYIFNFTRARAETLEGNLDQSLSVYQQLVDSLDVSIGLKNKAKLNSAVIFYAQGEYEKCFTILKELEQMGENSFELFYALAVISLKKADLTASREYTSKAEKAADKKNKFLLSNNFNIGDKLKSAEISPGEFFKQLFSKQAVLSKKSGDSKLSSILFYFIPSKLWVAFGCLLVAFSLLMMKGKRQRRKSVRIHRLSMRSEFPSESILWVVIPAGLKISGAHPLRGGMCLVVILSLLLVGLNGPLQFFPVIPGEQGSHSSALILFLISYLFAVLWGIKNFKDFHQQKVFYDRN